MKRSLLMFSAVAAFAVPAITPLSVLAQDRSEQRQDRPQSNRDQTQNRPVRESRPVPQRPDSNARPAPQPPRADSQRPQQPVRGDRRDNARPPQDRNQSRPQPRPDRKPDQRPGNRDDRPYRGPVINRPNDERDNNRREYRSQPPRNDRHVDRRPQRDRMERDFRRNWNHDQWRRDWDRRNQRDWWRYDNRFRNWSGVRFGFYFAPGYGYYNVPQNYWNRHWYAGQYLPDTFWRFRVNDWRTYGLGYPPSGTRWVYVDNAIYLIDEYDGYIIEVVRDAWRW